MGRTRTLEVSAALRRVLDLETVGGLSSEPATPRQAAALVLVRDTREGLECFLTRAIDDPGVDERGRFGIPYAEIRSDEARRVPLSGWGPDKMATTLRMTNTTKALQFYTAAARVALQSCGLLLADNVDGILLSDLDTPLWARSRQEVVKGEISFPDMLATRELWLRTDLLHPWMRWVNAEAQLKRFDTMVFVCAVPPGQEVDFVSSTQSWGGWMRPERVLGAEDAHADFMPAMVRIILEDLVGIRNVGTAMARVNDLSPVLPDIAKHDGQWRLLVTLPATMAGSTLVRQPKTYEAMGDRDGESKSLVDTVDVGSTDATTGED